MFCILMLGAKLTRKEDAMICKSADSAGERPAVPTLPNAVTPGPRSTEESSSLTWTWLVPAETGSHPLPSATPCPLLPCAPSTRFFADLTCLSLPCSHVCHTLLPSRPPGQGRLTPQSALVSEAPLCLGPQGRHGRLFLPAALPAGLRFLPACTVLITVDSASREQFCTPGPMLLAQSLRLSVQKPPPRGVCRNSRISHLLAWKAERVLSNRSLPREETEAQSRTSDPARVSTEWQILGSAEP